MFLACLLLSAPLRAAQENPFNIPPELDKAISSGLWELYNLNFDKALEIFKKIEDQSDEHPMVAFGVASVHWWRLSVYVLESDPKESAEFLKTAQACIKLSKAKIAKGDPTGEAYLTLGGAEGLLGRWQAANKEYMTAYFTGKSAYKNLRRSLKENPKMYDAYMGLGIFDYYVATLPAIVRVLAFLGQGGDPQKGLDELEQAGDKGNYARTPSLLFLVNIYSTLENKPEKAKPVLDRLWVEFPNSPFIHMLRIVFFYNHGPDETLMKEARAFQERVDKGVYRTEFAVQSRFAIGAAHFHAEEWDKAVEQFDLALKTGNETDPFYTWAMNYKGYALDMLGKREEAVALYKAVLKKIRRWGSHDNAKARLKKPFSEKSPELKKLIL